MGAHDAPEDAPAGGGAAAADGPATDAAPGSTTDPATNTPLRDAAPSPGTATAATPDVASAAGAATVPSSSRHPVLRWWTWPLLVTALFLVLQSVIGSGWGMFPDSYRYAKQAEIVLGTSPAQAHTDALDAFCRTRAAMRTYDGGRWMRNDRTSAQIDAAAATCVAGYAGRGDLTTTDPRYQQIFTTRPGYPLLAAPFVAAFGIADGMRVLGFVIACAGGLLTYTALRLWGVRATAAAAGQAAYLVSPLGWWALQALGEGLVSVCILGAVAGIAAIRRGRPRGGLVAMAASWCALGLVRYSTLLLAAAALAVACLAVALFTDRGDRARRRAMLAAAALSGAATAATMIAMPVFGLPGSDVTLQDTFTRHFADPLVPDPWRRLAALNYHFWPDWITTPSSSWLLLGLAAAGAAVLIARSRDLAWVAGALFAVGVAHVAAHPLPGEADRLGLLMWMPAVLGLAVGLHAVGRGWRVSMTPPSHPAIRDAASDHETADAADDAVRDGADHR